MSGFGAPALTATPFAGARVFDGGSGHHLAALDEVVERFRQRRHHVARRIGVERRIQGPRRS